MTSLTEMLTAYVLSTKYVLNHTQESALVTGVKRDTLLLKNVTSVKNSILTVLDISSHANRGPLLKLLKQGNTIHYFDHHFSG